MQVTLTNITAFKWPKRSPIPIQPRRGKENVFISRSNTVLGGNLSRIREESTELEGFRDDTYRDLQTNDLPGDEEKDDFEDVDDDVAEWDEESTLVALLGCE